MTFSTSFASPSSPPSSRDQGRRTGATWVAATGAGLLLAAACVFVAANWDHIPDAVKLALLGGITGVAVVAGDRLRSSLPATGSALFHLGALLVPVNVAAVDVRLGATWREMMLHGALVSLPASALLAARSRSVVLGAATSAAVVALAGGIAANTALPAPFVLAVAAAALVALDRKRAHALVWATLAGFAPVVTLALHDTVLGHGVAADLGVLVVRPWAWPLATGALAAAVVGVEARRRDDTALLVLAAGALVAHGAVGWSAAGVTRDGAVLVLPSLFVLAELAAFGTARDRFWATPSTTLAVGAEITAVVPTTLLAIAAAWLPRSATATVAAALLAIAWAIGAARRTVSVEPDEGDDLLAATFAAGAFVAAIGAATANVTAVATAAVVIAAASLLVAPRRWYPVGLGFSVFASFSALPDVAPVATHLTVPLAAAFLAAGVSRRLPGARPNEHTGVTAAALACLALGAFGASAQPELGVALVAPAWVAGWWVLGCAGVVALVDPVDRAAAELGRVAALAVMLVTLSWPPADALVPALALAGFGAVDAWHTRRPSIAALLALPVVQLEFALAAQAGLATATTGIALTVAASVWLGLAALGDASLRRPLCAIAALSTAAGLAAATNDAGAFGVTLTITGALLAGAALVIDERRLLVAAGAVTAVGVWVQLAAGGVQMSEPYVAPVVLSLLVAGWRVRAAAPEAAGAGRTGSWAAYGPAIALLGASPVVERLRGGGAGHAMAAGAVALVAIVVGGSRRLSAPLLLGTATLAVIGGHEVLRPAAGVPLAAWLAAGGLALLGAAVAIERSDTSPVEAGRRVVDVLSEQFE